MEDVLPGLIPGWALLLLGLCLFVLLVWVGIALFGFLFKVGVVVNEARKPPHSDTGTYRLDQGHEVRSETATASRTDGPTSGP